MTKLEEHSLWLAANDNQDANLNPLETDNPAPPVPPVDAENNTNQTSKIPRL